MRALQRLSIFEARPRDGGGWVGCAGGETIMEGAEGADFCVVQIEEGDGCIDALFRY
jgi:hypothetical protein